MTTKFKHLPPLTALRAFEAAARHCSFKRAAAELCITPAAISRQIKQLEQRLALTLFIRSHRRVVLSPQGQQLYTVTNSAFVQLNNAAKDLQHNNHTNYLNLQATSSFMRLWMIPRLQRLKQQHPSLQLNLISVESEPKASDNFEAAITLGLEENPNYTAELLFSEEVFVICSPEFLQRNSNTQVNELTSLVQLPLLDLNPDFWRAKWWTPLDWKTWLQQQGINAPKVNIDMYFSHYPMLIDAVLQGLGLGLGWQHLVADLLESGRLVRPLNHSYQAAQRCHYFVCRNDLIATPAMQTLRRWLIDETAILRNSDARQPMCEPNH